MDLGETVIVAGIGCRKGISAVEVETAVAAALRATRLTDLQLTHLAIPAAKAEESALHAVAAARNIPLHLVPQSALEAAAPRTLTRSIRAMAAMNVPSVAEAAALAAAGPQGSLLAPRMAVGPVTCALAGVGRP